MSTPGKTAPDEKGLLSLSMVLLDAARRRLYWSMCLGGIGTALALLVIAVPLEPHPQAQLLVELVSAASAVLAYICLRLFQQRYDLANEARRLVLLNQGLGWDIPPIVRTRILDRAGQDTREQASRRENIVYWDAHGKGEPLQLLLLLQQSAFRTYHMYRKLQRIVIGILIALLLLTSGAMWAFLLSNASLLTRTTFARLVLGGVPAVVSLGLLSWSLSLGDLSNALERVDNELENLRLQGDPPEREVMRFFAEYSCQMAQGLPIPKSLYNKSRAELDELWHEARQDKPPKS